MVSEELRERYWAVIRRTRQSGRVSPSVIAKVEESWKRFDDDVVEEALKIHTSRYPAYREQYTAGIMRNLQRQKQAGQPVKRGPASGMMRQDYDFEQIEQEFLAN
ncbi:MAG: hypothetical protein NC123_18915 [Butyrivibrio sp.]|nr:hypothetical protein [Acetatifactor muris]MCM1561584.1 hypothetical protein [Butyrivibrio sp.]